MNGEQPGMRVRAVMHEDAIYVRLSDLLGYVAYPMHQLSDDARLAVAGLLQRLGEALEDDG